MTARVATPVRRLRDLGIRRPSLYWAMPWLGAALSFVLAVQLLTGGKYGVLVLGGAAAAILLARPRPAAYLLLVLACSLWYTPRVPMAFGGVRTDEVELLAYGLMGWWLLSLLLRQPLPGKSVYGRAFAVMLLMMVVETSYSLTHTGERGHVIANVKTFGLYFLVLPLCALFGTRKLQNRLERAVLALATVGGLAVLGAVATGVQLEGRPGTAIDVNDLAATSRIRPALLPILLLATLIVVGRLSASGFSLRLAAMLAVFVGVWGVSFNRSSWVALAISCLLLVALRPGPRDLARTAASGLGVAVLLPVLFAAASGGLLGAESRAVAGRMSTIFSGAVVHSGSYDDRRKEYDDAIPALEQQPVFGVGIGGLYGARRPYYDPGLGIVRYQNRPFSHNSWLYLYLQTGLLGLVAFGMLLAAVLRLTKDARRSGDPVRALRSTTMACALVGVLLEALFNPNLLVRPNIIGFAVALALVCPVEDRDEAA